MKKERNLKFILKNGAGKKFDLVVDVPSGSQTADFLREIQSGYNLVESAFEWLFDGWGIEPDLDVSPLMIAATLEKEARGYDNIAVDPKNYPDAQERADAKTHAARLRSMVARICRLEAARMAAH